MKTCIKLDEEDLKKLIKNQFRDLHDPKVMIFAERHAGYGGSSTYTIRAEVTTEEDIIMC